jgi:methionyl-tRNA synthetase
LLIYLKPIVPELTLKAEAFFNIAPLTWDDLTKPLLDHQLNAFTPLITRVDELKVNELIQKKP